MKMGILQNSILDRIHIGTANFNSHYGLSNNRENVENLLGEIWASGITKLDLSNKYLFGLKDLKNDRQNWHIQLKIHVDTRKPEESYRQELNYALLNINTNNIDRVLIHNGDEFLYENNISDLNKLFEMTPGNIKFGISLYDLPNLLKVIDTDFVKIIQFPANIFDRRLAGIKENFQHLININHKILQARSIFLQGLILNNYSTFPQNLISHKNIFENWYLWNTRNNIDLLESSLGEVLNHQKIGEATIGIDSSEHLKQIINVNLNQLRYVMLESIPDVLIDPRKWQK
jgi:aryl-alcohol dehydrogenase-like predicted oxidoreductase